MLTNRPRGTNDILPGQVERWQSLEGKIRRLCREYGYGEIRTPIFEHTILFNRGVGETTDVVEKEMYTFMDRGKSSLTLRPEATAAIVRAYIENGMYGQPQPIKLFLLGPMFRYDRPQAGRFRQFHQFDVEVLGTRDPLLDVELIALANSFCQQAGLKEWELHINSVGCPTCRTEHRKGLREYVYNVRGSLCEDCQRRLETNPMRVLDCKNEKCQRLTVNAPTPVDYLCDTCAEHFAAVKRGLEEMEVAYQVDKRLVRGLDYYTMTAFELMVPGIGAQNSIGGGGRYDGLVEACGGPPTPGVGFAFGMERVLLALEEQRGEAPNTAGLEVYVGTLEPGARIPAMKLLNQLRSLGIAADMDYLGRSLKAQMKAAGKSGAPLVVIVGGDELGRGAVTVRQMDKAKQEEVSLDQAGQYLLARLVGMRHKVEEW
ncbi:MAG: histidine--tRNA ligase [Firmicutes bacterium]|nr:histidine--tRNA ligase [Bacillota bacterium]